VAELPFYLRLEQKCQAIYNEIEEKGWLVDRELMLSHIDKITSVMNAIDKYNVPKLPKRVIPFKNKTQATLKTPLTKTFKYTAGVKKWFRNCEVVERPVVGSFSRVEIKDFDLNKVAQVKDYLLSAGWEPEEWNFSKKTGERTSPKMTYTDPFIGVDGQAPRKIARRVQYKHRRSNIQGLVNRIREDGRIPQVFSGLADTGRCKHAGIVNIPNAQALLGKKMREIFVCPEGYSLVGTDAASCQVRMLLHYLNNDEYTEAMTAEGAEVHQTNADIVGITRSEAKTLLYAILFGAGPTLVGKQLDIDNRAADKLIKKFKKAIPGLDRLEFSLKHKWKDRGGEKGGYMIGLDGRKVSIKSEHKILNYLLQSAEAIYMKVVMCMIWNRLRKLDAHIISFYHDEFTVECSNKIVPIVRQIKEECFIKGGTYLKLNCPMKGDSKVGKNWYEIH
jgi:hypothetical protein